MKAREKRRTVLMTIAACSLCGILALAVTSRRSGVITIPRLPQITPEPAKLVYVTPSGKKYHRTGCTSLAEAAELTEYTVAEALEAGYGPCKRCAPGGEYSEDGYEPDEHDGKGDEA